MLLRKTTVCESVSLSLFLILSLSCSLSEGRGGSRSQVAFAFSPDSLLSLTGHIPPVTVYDQDGFKVMIHFSRDLAPGRPDVLVMVLSMLSTSTQPIKDIVFQAAVPKVRMWEWDLGKLS